MTSKLREQLVRRTEITGDLSDGINADLGTMFDYRGPFLGVQFHHEPAASDPEITAAIDW